MSLTLLKDQFGVLLVNLGTPDAPTAKAVKRYLAQFLSDRRVVDTNPFIWYPILRGVILPFRSPRVAKLYGKVWMDEGSPLLVYTQRQQYALSQRLPEVPVEIGMTYGNPAIAEGLNKLRQQDVHTIVVLPLYPQYSSTTTAAVWDTIIKAVVKVVDSSVDKKSDLPEIRFIRDYADHPNYIAALCRSIEASFRQHGRPDLLLFSYHGIPQRYADEGDEYPIRCEVTTRLVVEALGLAPDQYMMTYQSYFGKELWLQPYTDQTIKTLPDQGIKHLQVICPGFASDCLETLEEIEVENRQLFIDAGGEKFEYIPALNDSEAHIDLFVQLIKEKI